MRFNPHTQKSFLRTVFVTFALVVYPAMGALGQQPATAQPDIYANFVGVWVGTGKYVKDGKETIEALRITIQETKKKDGLRWDYRYGTGEKEDDRPTRHVTFRPAKAEIVLQWDNDEGEHYKAVDLDVFAKNGYGAFYAINTNQEDGKKITYLLKIDLEPDTFRYAWFRSEDGKNFARDSSFVLKREVSGSVSH
jgi:hypothetical protein